MVQTNNPFAGVGKAPLNFGGAYVLEGKHALKIKECKLVRSQQKNADMFIAVFNVIESSNPAMLVGSERSWAVNFQHPSALSNLKTFVVAALNCKEEDVDEATCSAIVHDSQPLRGVVLNCEGNTVKTKRGTDFTKMSWSFLKAA